MEDLLGKALGAIAAFCESVAISEIRILQCDVVVTVDEWVRVEELEAYEIRGMGGSDMSAALVRLADDPEVESVIVLTDGDIAYPNEEPPYRLLWALVGDDRYGVPMGADLSDGDCDFRERFRYGRSVVLDLD